MIAGATVTLDPALDFGRYELLREIGRGASGTVYLARDTLIGREVAIKSFVAAGPTTDRQRHGVRSLRDDLLREARNAGVLSHPNIVTVYDLVERSDRTVFLAMEYVRGRNLGELLAAGRKLEFERAVDLVAQVASALDYLHTMGVVHRDIKPANILIDESGQVKLTDFGIASLGKGPLGDDGGLILGTPSYMAPEQLLGREVTGRADVYSLAVVLFEMLTGRPPFQGSNVAEVVHQVVHAPPPDATAELPGSSPRLQAVFERALAKDPQQRYASGGELATELRQILYRPAGGVDAGSTSATQILDRTLLGLPPRKTTQTLASRWHGVLARLRSGSLVLPAIAGAVLGVLAAGAVIVSSHRAGDGLPAGDGPSGVKTLRNPDLVSRSTADGASAPAAPRRARLRVEFSSDAPEGVVTIYAGGLRLLHRGFSYYEAGRWPSAREPSRGGFAQEIAVPSGTSALWIYVARPGEPARRIQVAGRLDAGSRAVLEIHVAADGAAEARLRFPRSPASPAPRAAAPAPPPAPPR